MQVANPTANAPNAAMAARTMSMVPATEDRTLHLRHRVAPRIRVSVHSNPLDRLALRRGVRGHNVRV